MLVTIPLCLSCHKQAIQGTVKKRVFLFCPLLMSMSPGLDLVDLSCDGEVLGKSWAQYWVSAAEA